MLTTICPTSERLAAFQTGRLALDDLNEIAEHVNTCPACQTALEHTATQSDSLIHELRAADGDDPFTQESGCQRAIAKVQDIAQGPANASTMDQVASTSDTYDGTLPTAIGKYNILGFIGAGGMGAVYKAFHPDLKRTCVLKVLPAGRLKDAHAKARFRREIEAAGQLDHRHIVRATDADVENYLVMDWLEGQDLSQVVRERGPLPVAEACEIIRQAAIGLDYAHRHDVIHRDVKPSNLMLTKTEDGQPHVKIIDFGLALLRDTVSSETELTSSGQVMGTYDFIGPEQAIETHNVDGRADIYSLGCTFYYLLTGKAPFAGMTDTQKLVAHQLHAPMPIEQLRSDVPNEVVAVVMKMMEKDPAQRFAAMRELAETLDKTSQTPRDATAFDAITRSDCPMPATAAKRLPVGFNYAIAIGLLAVLGLIAWGGITIIIRNKDGSITKIEVPKDAGVEIKKDDKTLVKIDPKVDGKKDKTIVKVDPKNGPPSLLGEPTGLPPLKPFLYKPIPVGQSPLDKLDPAAIPKEERFEWQPKELVAVIGTHARRHWGSVVSLAFSPDGKYACSSSRQELIIWDVASQLPVASFPYQGYVSFSEDSKTLYSHSTDGGNYVIDLTKRPPVATMSGKEIPEPGDWMWHQRLENRRTLLAYAETSLPGGRRVVLVDVSGKKPVVGGAISCSWSGVPRFYMSQSGAAIYQSKGKLRRVEVKDGRFVNDRELAIADGIGVAQAISGDGTRAAIWIKDALELWDISLEKPKRLCQIKGGTVGERFQYVLSHDGRWMSSSHNQTALWRIDDVEPRFVDWIDQTSDAYAANVAFSRDGKRAVVGSPNGFVRFWDLSGDTPKELSPLEKTQAFITRSWLSSPHLNSRSGQLVLHTWHKHWHPQVATSQRYQVWALDQPTPRPTPAPEVFLDTNSSGPVFPVGNNSWLSIPDNSIAAQLYHIEDGQWQPQGAAFGEPKCHGAATADGRMMVQLSWVNWKTAGYELSAWGLGKQPSMIWRVQLGAQKTVSSNAPRPVIISADQRLCVTAFPVVRDGSPSDGELLIWKNLDTRADLAARIAITKRQQSALDYCIDLSPDSKYLAHLKRTAKEIVLEDLSKTIPCEVQKRGQVGECFWLAFSPDGKRLACASSDGLRILEVPTLKTLWLWKSPGPVNWCEWAEDGRHLVTHNGNKTVYVLRFDNKLKQTAADAPILDLQSPVPSVGFVDDDTVIVGCGQQIHFWNWRTGKRSEIEDPNCRGSFVLSPDRTKAVFGFDTSALILLDCKTQKKQYFKGVDEPIAHAVFTPDGKKMIGVGRMVISTFDVANCERLDTMPVKWDWLNRVAVSPVDGKLLVLSSKAKEFRLFFWDPEASKSTEASYPYMDAIGQGFTYSKDGKRILGSGFSSVAFRLFDTATLKAAEFRGHEGLLWALAFSPDGKRILSGSSDKTARLWNIDTREELMCLKGHTKDVTAVAFSPNGLYAVSGSKDGTVRVWRLPE